MKKIPIEVLEFILLFDPRGVRTADEFDVWLSSYVNSLKERKKKIVNAFLDELLRSPLSDAQLGEIWNHGGPTFGVANGGYRAFLTLIKSKL